MIERNQGQITIECDATTSCNATYEGERGDAWETVWPAAKRNGWTTKKIGSDWLHACPKCRL